MSHHRNNVAGLQEVKVDQRALVNMLARYPGTFDVLRELIQNADDADARNIEVQFETEKAEGSQPASKPDVNQLKIRKWIIKDNGKGFKDKDWERLGTIAAGNDDPTKVGAFGVGFYSVLSMSDRPLVRSNGKSLQFHRGKDGKLRKPGEPKADDSLDSRTSIELELRDPEQLPVLVDLARFLVSSVAFLTNINSISIHLDTQRVLCIEKQVQPLVELQIPQHLKPTTPLETLTVESIQHAVQRIAVDAAEWAFPASPTLSLPEDDTGDTLAEQRSKEDHPTHTSPSVSAILEDNAITHDLYTVTTRVNLRQDSKMKIGVESCMKSLPPSFTCKAVYFNSEQYDSLASVNGLDSPEAKHLARFFCGSQGIFPKHDSGRLFIGQSTNQTTGIGLHISGHFLPTMERGAIDLANGQVKVWNEEVLHIGGVLARVIYEEEMNAAKSKGRLATQLGLRTMDRFAFGRTVPHGGVSQILQDAFFSCCYAAKSPLPVVSDAGISCALKDQFRRSNLPFLKKYRVLHGEVQTLQRSEIIRRYDIPELHLEDIVQEFESGGTLDAMTSLFRWCESFMKRSLPKNIQDRFCNEFSSRGVLKLSHNVKIPLKKIRYFTFFPLPNGLSHPNSIYIDVTQGAPTRDTVKCFGWTQLSLLDWLGHVCSQVPHLTSSEDSGRDSDMGYRILRVLVRFALVEDLTPDQWDRAAKLMKHLKCIPTTDNRRELPANSYFDVADICRSLPVTQEKDCLETSVTHVATQMGFDFKMMNLEHVRKVLTSIHVRKMMTPESWEDMVRRLERDASKESNYRLLRYLATILREKLIDWQQFEQLLDGLKGRKVFYSENHGQQSADELLLPTEGVPELNLPTLALPHDGIISLQSVVDQFGSTIDTLNIQRYPSLDRIIERATSDEPKVRDAALQYLLLNLDIHYKAYKSDNFATVAFIPTKGGSLARPNEVFTSAVWEKLGFKQVPDDLRRRLSRLGVKEDPPVDMIIDYLRTPERTLPDRKTAATWFEQLHLHGNLPSSKLRELSTIPFVPFPNPDPASSGSPSIQYICPKDCFITSAETKQYHLEIFTFLNFGQDGNNFLDSCYAKKSPSASDIVSKIVQDPQSYLKALRNDTKLYLDDLRTIASQLDLIPEEDKQAMKKARMFPDGRSGAKKLFTAEQVLFRDWESRDFGGNVSVAPKDKVLEKLYREMGSAFLGTYVRHDVHTIGNTPEGNPPFTRDQVIQRIDHFMEKREKSRKTDVSFDDLGVGACESITLKKTFTPPDGVLADVKVETKSFQVKAASKLNEDGKSYTLWMVRDDDWAALRNDIAVALCHILLQTYGPNDVMLLASLFRMTDDKLREHYGGGTKSKLRSVSDAKETPLNDSKKKLEWKVSLPPWLAKVVRAPKAKTEVIVFEPTISAEEDMRRAVESWGTSGLIDEAPDPTAPSQPPSTSPKKYNTYCQLAHTIKLLEKQHLQDKETEIRFFLTKGAQCQQPPQLALEDFAKLISRLARVFGQEKPSQACYIFWQDKDDNLMAFNRDQKYIFLNLAHYHRFFCVKRVEKKEMITEWYLIMAHEIAHNLTMEHGEYHGTLSASLAAKYLPDLYKEFPDVPWEKQS